MIRPAVAGGPHGPIAAGGQRAALQLNAGHQGTRAERPGLRHGLGPVRGRRLAVAEHAGQQGQVPVHGTPDGGADALHDEQPGVRRQGVIGPAGNGMLVRGSDHGQGLGDLGHYGQPL